MRTIMFLNAKGGCGKSTLATNLASYYAKLGNAVVLADFDPQGSSLGWLAARSKDAPEIHGLPAWREGLRHLPRSADYAILDVPAGAHGAELTALVRRAQSIVIPVLPAPTDIRAAARFIHHLLLVGRVERKETKLAVVANRVRENTAMQKAAEGILGGFNRGYTTVNTQNYQRLEKFLSRLKIPFITTLRENPYYLVADARGLGIFDLKPAHVARDLEQWKPLIHWLESRRSLPDPD
ncbi:MAG TPA: ParA family protein [Burkholderiales bacterium]|nr:ParA family protein [Burkholderiales bacterium]